MSLHVDRPDTMQNEEIHISASGLRPGAVYNLLMTLEHKYGTHRGFAAFKADGSGSFDVATTAPIRGTYSGADPMGLFMSLLPCEDFAFGGYLRCTPPIPFVYQLSLLDESEKIVDEIYIKKHWAHPALERTEIEGEFCATLFKPPGDGPFPCILDISGTGGGIHEHKGAMLASEGFVVLCVAFFQFKNLPAHLQNVDMNYFKKPIDYLLSLPYTNDIMGIQGVSFGATIVDYLATKHHRIKAVVSINGPHAFSSYTYLKEDGKDLPLTFMDDQCYEFTNGILKSSQNFRTMTDHITPETEIPWWNVPKDTEFRVVGSVDDMCQPSVHCTYYRQKRLKETGHKVEIELVNGGHIMEPPYFPHHEIVFAKFQGFYCGYGGEVVLHGKSQERTWTNTIKFFTRILGQPTTMPDWDRLKVVPKPVKEDNRSHL